MLQLLTSHMQRRKLLRPRLSEKGQEYRCLPRLGLLQARPEARPLQFRSDSSGIRVLTN